MSAAGLPMEDHIPEHFGANGLCQCPCEECTTRTARFCVCPDCPCDLGGPDAPQHSQGTQAWPSEFTCPACGRPESRCPPDHELASTEDACGWPIMICNYGTMVITYRVESWGAGGPAPER